MFDVAITVLNSFIGALFANVYLTLFILGIVCLILILKLLKWWAELRRKV